MRYFSRYYPTFILLLGFFSWKVSANEFDFGLMENEPLLQQLFKEDRDFLQEMYKVNERFPDIILEKFLKEEFNSSLIGKLSAEEYVQHPINVFHLIRRNAVLIQELLSQMSTKETVEEATKAYEDTTILKTLNVNDLHKAINAIVIMIHSYELNIDEFSKGDIVVSHMVVDGPIRAVRPLDAIDLFILARHAEKNFGYLGTAANIVKTALNLSEDLTLSSSENETLRKSMLKFKKEILIKHNGYLEKSKAIVTDKHVFSPYMLDENLERKKKQPKFVTTEKLIDAEHIIDAVVNDGAAKFKTDSMLKSCGGILRKNLNYLNNGVRSKSEGDIHKCRLVHHKDPYTKLGPFKLEIVHNNPFLMVIHELFTEEDRNYLVDWARPRLSRNREITLAEDRVKNKNAWMSRKTVSILI